MRLHKILKEQYQTYLTPVVQNSNILQNLKTKLSFCYKLRKQLLILHRPNPQVLFSVSKNLLQYPQCPRNHKDLFEPAFPQLISVSQSPTLACIHLLHTSWAWPRKQKRQWHHTIQKYRMEIETKEKSTHPMKTSPEIMI